MSVQALDAYLYGEQVAQIRGGDKAGFAFMAQSLARWGQGSAVLSVLLPLTHTTSGPLTARGRVWLSGLLPEGRARTRMAERAGVDPDDLLGFLAVYGRDTAGAVLLVPAGENPSGNGHEPKLVSDEQIGLMLDEAAAHGAADQLTSIGGLEAKVVLTLTSGGFALPTPTHPSTHIVKLSRPAGSLTADLIDTECAALDLARRAGAGTVEARISDFAGRRALVVRRYDRITGGHGIDRIHQEDSAQALGIDTRDPDRKFQYGRGLPSLAVLARALDTLGVDTSALLTLTTFNLAIGNTDAHAKNISVLHLDDGGHDLAPAYDVAMHTHHAHADGRFAMDVAGKRGMADLTGQDLVDEAKGWGLAPVRAARVVTTTLDRLEEALREVDRSAHPGVVNLAWTTVEQRVRHLRATAPAARPRLSRRTRRTDQPRAPRGTPTGGRFRSGHPDG